MKGKKRLYFNYKRTVFICIMVIMLVPTIILGMFSYKTYTSGVSDKIHTSTKAMVSQVKSKIDTALDSIRRSYLYETSRDELSWLINSDISYSDYSHLKKASDILSGSNYYLSYISGYTFINFDTGWVLSNRGLYRYNEVKNKETVEEIFKHYEGTFTRSFWLDNAGMEDIKLSREEVKINGVSLIIKAPTIKKNPNCLMIINIDMDFLQRKLREDLGGGDITVLDDDGNVIYTTDVVIASYAKNHMDKIKTAKNIRLNGDRSYSVATAHSAVLKWTYLVSYDMDVVSSKGDSILYLTIALIIGIITITGMSILLTKKLYKPVFLLTERIGNMSLKVLKNEDKNKQNEFDYINDRIERLVDNRNFYENLVISQQPQLVELFQIRMIRGSIDREKIYNYVDKFKIQVQNYYMLMLGALTAVDKKDLSEDTNLDAIRINMIESLPDYVKSMMFIPPISYENSFILPVSGATIEELEEKVSNVYYEIEKFVTEKYDLQVNIGVSHAHSGLEDYRVAYHESLEAMKNILFIGSMQSETDCNGLLFYSAIKENNTRYSYDRLSEKKLKEAIDTSNLEEAFQVIDEFMDGLIEKNVIQSECYLHIQRFVISGLLIATDAGLSLDDIFEDNLRNNLFQQMNKIFDMGKMRYFIKHKVIEPVITKLNEYRMSKSSDTMKDIEQLIEQSDGNITLAECAEQLNYHPSYIWKVTKMNYNTTFTDYVGNYKLVKAKKLLLETDKTIADIAEELNYTNSQNFIRFFNKMEGITPGKYRQQYKKMNS